MKMYVVKSPYGEYEDYQEQIDKLFIDKKKAQQYIEEENAKLPLDQAKKCEECYFKWDNAGQRGKTRPNCYNGDKYNMCQEYNKYRDISKLFFEEHEIQDFADHDKQVRKQVCDEIRNKLKENGLLYTWKGEPKYKTIEELLDKIEKGE